MGLFDFLRPIGSLSIEECVTYLMVDVIHHSTSCTFKVGQLYLSDKERGDLLVVRSSVFKEFCFLLVHRIFRMSVQLPIDDAKRKRLLDGMVLNLATVCEKSNLPEPNYQQHILNEFAARHAEYLAFESIVPEVGGQIKGTLYWEFGKHVCEALGSPMDAACILFSSKLASQAICEIPAKKILLQL